MKEDFWEECCKAGITITPIPSLFRELENIWFVSKVETNYRKGSWESLLYINQNELFNAVEKFLEDKSMTYLISTVKVMPTPEEVLKELDKIFNSKFQYPVQTSIDNNILKVQFFDYEIKYDPETQAKDNEMGLFVDKAWKKHFTAKIIAGILAGQIVYKIVNHD